MSGSRPPARWAAGTALAPLAPRCRALRLLLPPLLLLAAPPSGRAGRWEPPGRRLMRGADAAGPTQSRARGSLSRDQRGRRGVCAGSARGAPGRNSPLPLPRSVPGEVRTTPRRTLSRAAVAVGGGRLRRSRTAPHPRAVVRPRDALGCTSRLPLPRGRGAEQPGRAPRRRPRAPPRLRRARGAAALPALGHPAGSGREEEGKPKRSRGNGSRQGQRF